MSISFPTLPSASQSDDLASRTSNTSDKPTSTQQVKQLAESGHSAAQIANLLGLPQSLVDSTLGIETTATATAESAVSTSRLSIKV